MDQWYQSASLLPYLTGVTDLQLDFPTVTGRTGLVESAGEVDCGYSHTLDNLALRYKSRIMCGGSVLRNVSLVIQRDEYLSFHSKPAPTNSTIDECWQRAFEQRRSPQTEIHHVFLNGHTSGEGNIRPFAPLSYCQERQRYFHPPCARCGKMLHLCTDDVLLGEFGLPHYRRSLRRYLYCPVCTPLHGAPWFTLRPAGEEDNVVKDRSGLLSSFGAVNDKVESGLGFPCLGCSLSDSCYGSENRVAERVTVVAFYPFYMFIDRLAEFDGEFFLGLLGGGAIREIEGERSRERLENSDFEYSGTPYGSGDGYLLPTNDARHFLEVLYLKLLFLEQAAGKGNSGSLLHYMSNRYVSPREIGVFRPDASTLPSYWNFALTFQSVEQELEHLSSSALKFRGSRMLYFGLFFFVVLLANRNRHEKYVLSELKQKLEQMKDSDITFSGVSELFHPGNIYWGSEKQPDDRAYGEVWARVVECGVSLLKGGLNGDSMERWLAEDPLGKCTKEVASLLFRSVSISGHTQENVGEDKEIVSILEDISAKWARDIKTDSAEETIPAASESPGSKSVDRNAKTQPDSFDPDATVIIPPDQDASGIIEEKTLIESKDFFNATLTQSFSNEPLPGDDSVGIGMSGTVDNGSEDETLISPAPFGQSQDQPGGQTGQSGATDEDGLLETVRIKKKAEDLTEQVQTGAGEKNADDLLEETVVLNSGTRERQPEPAIQPPSGDDRARNEVHQDQTKRTNSPDDEDDFLTETVVLKPKKKDD